jgi:uroporphyrinogen decarboxylase
MGERGTAMPEMTCRERFLCAARRGIPDRVARDIWLEAGVSDMLREHFGMPDLVYALRQDVVGLGPDPTVLETDFSSYFTRPGVTWDEWGRGRIWDSQIHYAEYLYPLERADTLVEIIEFPWPDLHAPYRFSWVEERVEELHARGLAVRAELAETIFEIAWQVRSMERLFDDMAHSEEMAAAVLDAITDRRVAEARAFAHAGVDAIFIGDDVAMQTGLMLSRKMWRKWFRPRLARVIAAAREIKPDMPVQYHSDGKIDDLIPDLIDLGVTILNPVQPECVDHAWVKAAYGDKLAFCGGLGVQSVLPFGTPEEVRQHTHLVIERLGTNGGLIIGPSHVIERDTPLENILAMLAAIDEFGTYS